MKKEYINIRISLKEEYYEFIYAELSDLPFAGIEERYDEIIITFDKVNYSPKTEEFIKEKINEYDKEAEIVEITEEIEKNWNEEWEKNVEPVKVNERILITPSWKAEEVESEIKLIINPKMSFGTGSHSTTRLVCRLAEKYVESGSLWIDAGTGTGVLAILAAKLGAEKVYAFDNNEWSFENANENLKLNNVSNVRVEQTDINEIQLPESNGIFANLFLHLIIPSLPLFYNSLKAKDGILLISGVLKYDEERLLNETAVNGFELIELDYEDEWLAGAFQTGGTK